MISYQSLYDYLSDSPLENWLEHLPTLIDQKLDPANNGNLASWYEALKKLSKLKTSHLDLQSPTVQIGTLEDLQIPPSELEDLLRKLIPWRKGPYNFFGQHIDTEWRSDWKWQRLEEHIQPLNNRLVLDVGCGNGYHCLRMLAAGADRVIGIDPGMLSVAQFHAIKHFLGDLPVDVLPLGLEQLPANTKVFDTVFSMGVLYHRRSPIDHLYELAGCLTSGGELVLETLVIEGEKGLTLVPEERYAQMRNVWFLPSCTTLQAWLKRCGFTDIKLIDVNQTTVEEQRSTDWMPFYSLAKFLDPNDSNKTCEGLPAPKRAIFTATCP